MEGRVMTTTINLWVFFGVALLCCLIGFAFGILAAWPPDDPRPRQPPPTPPEDSPLPRPGYLDVRLDDPYPTVPALIWSPHAATLAAHEREIEQMTAAARKYLP
jgi:hypothetical protein